MDKKDFEGLKRGTIYRFNTEGELVATDTIGGETDMNEEDNIDMLKEKLKRNKQIQENAIRDIEDLQEVIEERNEYTIQLQDELIKALTGKTSNDKSSEIAELEDKIHSLERRNNALTYE